MLSYPKGELAPPPILSPAEAEIAVAVALGRALAEIASERQTTARTVRNQVRAIYEKLGVHSRVDLARALLDSSTPRRPPRAESAIKRQPKRTRG